MGGVCPLNPSSRSVDLMSLALLIIGSATGASYAQVQSMIDEGLTLKAAERARTKAAQKKVYLQALRKKS